MKKVTIAIEGMHCQGCVNSVQQQLHGITGVASVSIVLT